MKPVRAAIHSITAGGGRVTPLGIAATVVVVIACLYWAQAVLIPFALAVLLTFLLSPIVNSLQRVGLGRLPSIAVVVSLTLALVITIGWIVMSQVKSLADEFPKYRHNIRRNIRDLRDMGKGGVLEKVQETVDEVKSEIEPSKTSQVIEVKPAESWHSLYLGPFLQPIASGILILGLLVFMLAEREQLRNRLLRLVGYAHLTVTTKALEEAGQRISRYLLMQITINSCFGLVVGGALFLIGLPYAFLWGFLSVPLLFIPLVGFWTAAALPTILSLGVFTDWRWPLLVVGLFLCLKTIINMFLEPLLYGRSVGVSAVPLLMMIAFWTWLWGPIGLVLATPLTVCLTVLGKYVPQMEFITVLMSDEAITDVKINFYQRLLARDQDEAAQIVAEHLKNHRQEHLYDEVLVPALNHAKLERERGGLAEADKQFIFQATREVVMKLGFEQQVLLDATDERGSAGDNSSRLTKIKILGCPAKDEADELALLMFRQLLDRGLYEVDIVSQEKLTSEVVAMAAEKKTGLVCIGSLPPDGLGETRHLCKRLARISPKPKIVVGRWGSKEDKADITNLLLTDGAGQVALSLLEAREQITNLRGLVCGSYGV
jgi:predicted PurR-regulated permease PerM